MVFGFHFQKIRFAMSKFKQPTTIRCGALLKCNACESVLKIPVEIMEYNFPLEMVCSVCSTRKILKNAMLPKVDPSLVSGESLEWMIPGMEDEPEQSLSSEIQEPFKAVTASIGAHTSGILSDIDKLKNQVEKFRQNVVDFFQDQWKYFSRFRYAWKHQYVQEWIDFPFTCFDAYSEDEYNSAYARYMLCPRFFDPDFGFKVPHGLGGMRLQLMNQYSRMNFPLDSFIIEQFKLPKNLDLRVAGNKILGSSLQLSGKIFLESFRTWITLRIWLQCISKITR